MTDFYPPWPPDPADPPALAVAKAGRVSHGRDGVCSADGQRLRDYRLLLEELHRLDGLTVVHGLAVPLAATRFRRDSQARLMLL